MLGAGTSTSDSIPARLSHGEFVIRAAAGRALRAAVLCGAQLDEDMLRGFNVGGIVDAFDNSMRAISPVQSFNRGGLALWLRRLAMATQPGRRSI